MKNYVTVIYVILLEILYYFQINVLNLFSFEKYSLENSYLFLICFDKLIILTSNIIIKLLL
jgi:hypothetical protein